MTNDEYYDNLNRAIYLIDGSFQNMAKTFLWLNSPCKELGNCIPINMIEQNKTKELLEFISNML